MHCFQHIQHFLKIQTRIADDKFSPAWRAASICSIIDATDFFSRIAILCNASMNSGSSEMLVW